MPGFGDQQIAFRRKDYFGGRAKVNSEERTELLARTTPGMVMGTISYMSPEQARGLPVDERTDIWSLGVILYEMIARRLPFPGATPSDRIAAILEREPEPLSKRGSGISPELEKIINRTLAKNANERYARAADLAAELRELRARLGDSGQRRLALPASPPRRWSLLTQPRALMAIAATILLLLAAVVAGLSYLRPTAGGAAINPLAILPLINTSGNEDTEYLSDGITESLINSLAQVPNLRMIARSSVFRYKGQEADPQAVGRELGAQAVLTGRVAQRGDQLSISVELVDVRDNRHIWGEQYNRRLTDLLAMQQEISRDIAESLRLRLTGETERRVTRRHTDNVEAYQLYLRGRYYWNRAAPEDLQRSRDYFQQAIDLDPAYALAYSGLSDFYGYSAARGFLPPQESWPRAAEATHRALEIDETLAEVHNSLAGIRMYSQRDWPGAEREFRRAFALNPNHAEAYHHYSMCLYLFGRFDESVAAMGRALEIDPLSLRYNRNLGVIYSFSRQPDKAIEQLRKTLDLYPRDAATHEGLGDAYEQRGMRAEAVAAWAQAMTLSGDAELAAILNRAYAESGFDEALRAISRKRLERATSKAARGEYVPAMSFLRAYVRLGDREQAFAWLERAYEERNRLIFEINTDPAFDSLRSDPRFAEFVRRLGLTPAS